MRIRLCVAICLDLYLLTGVASAGSIDTLIFFGDSLTDEGRAGRTAPVMWPGVLQNDVSITAGANYAVGGSFTGHWTSATVGPGGFLDQVAGFVAASLSGNTTTAANIWTGTNNVWIYSGQGKQPSQIAADAVADVTSGLTSLAATGVSKVNLLGVYDLSLTNAYMLAGMDTIATRAAAAQASQLYNAQLASLSIPSETITYYNIANFINHLQTNPQAYGFTRVLPLLPGETCDATCQQTSVFADTIHLTSKAQQLIGDYLASGSATYNSATFTYGAIEGNIESVATIVPELGYFARSIAANTATETLTRLRSDILAPASGPSAPTASGLLTVYVSPDGAFDRMAGSSSDADSRQTGLTLGIDYRSGNSWRAGALIKYTYLNSNSKAVSGVSSKWDDVQVAVYGSLSSGNSFVEGIAGIGHDTVHIARTGSFGQTRGTASGTSLFAAGSIGYDFDLGFARIAPITGLTTVATTFDGYSETGAPLSAVTVGRQTSQSVTGSIGYDFRSHLAALSMFSPDFTLTYEHQFVPGRTNLAASYAYLPTQTLPVVSVKQSDAIRGQVGLTYDLENR